jgi:CubicO group peptidase (beta-lactamase class C family)/beta-glucosidase-like glycosyl hydrolase
MKRALILGFIICFTFSNAQTAESWADSLLNNMSVSEKIGQLFMIPISTYATAQEVEGYALLIQKYQPGSLYITKGSAKSHIRVVNKLQQASKIPLLVGMNAEWGLAQTLDSTFNFPQPLIVGTGNNDSLMRNLGYQIGSQMRAVGAHINFAPHADIDVPFESTVTSRYFGTNKERVARKSVAFANGLKEAGVMAVAKHLPGITPEMKSKSVKEIFAPALDTVSFYPYQQLIKHNVGGILTSHLHFSSKDDNKSLPAPLSQIFISEMIKSIKGFNGLTFTDIPYLKTVVRKGGGETEKLAFRVGNDVLIAPDNIKKALTKIVKLVNSKENLMQQLNVSVKKILMAKYQAGLSKERMVEPINLEEKLFSVEAKLLDNQFKLGAVTLLSNSNRLVPIQQLDNRKFFLVNVGGLADTFEAGLNRYAPFQTINIQSSKDTVEAEKIMTGSVCVLSLKSNAKTFSGWIRKISKRQSIIVCHFGNPGDLKYLSGVPELIEGYDETSLGEVAAQVIFGAVQAKGALPVAIGNFAEGISNDFSPLDRLTYSLPEEAGMSSQQLNKIDNIANEAIAIGATPGARVIVARQGKVIFNKSYGWQDIDKKYPVSENTIYDLASVTKITATLQAVMFMHDRGLIDINKKISVYLPEFNETNKKDITIKDILTHQAGLWPYFPWHVNIMKDSVLIKQFFSTKFSTEYPFQVSDKLFSHKAMRDSMWHWILTSKMVEKKNRTPYEYRYSDLGLYIMQRLSESILNQPLEDFVAQNFYEPIGASTTVFRPLEHFPASRIAPTENDKAFRGSLLTGYVHDPGAAMFGGVAGHAGLFSNANDLLKMGQMWLQKGSYGGLKFIKPETINQFSARQFETSRRGLGWDKPTGDWNGSTGVYCSPATFGHTGFTGTCIWVDPEFDLVFVFLSNRVHPEVTSKLLSSNIRTRIQDVIYQSIFNYNAVHFNATDKIISETKTSY